MFFSKKGQSILENIVTVTLVSLGIVLAWEPGYQLISGAVKELVSRLEDRDPHKYIKQAPPGGGIVVPGCNCTPWVEACNAVSGNRCGNDFMKAKWRTCLPAGCENTVHPPIPTLVCDNSDPTCCTTPLLDPGGIPASCGRNAACSINPPTVNCFSDGFCPDGTGHYRKECQFPGNASYECVPYPFCQFNCNLDPRTSSNPNGLPANAFWCTPLPSGYDHVRLLQDEELTVVVAQSQCPSSVNATKCKSYCAPPRVYNPATRQCEMQDVVVETQDNCLCAPQIPASVIINTFARCQVGYIAIGGWCDFVDSSGSPIYFPTSGPFGSSTAGTIVNRSLYSVAQADVPTNNSGYTSGWYCRARLEYSGTPNPYSSYIAQCGNNCYYRTPAAVFLRAQATCWPSGKLTPYGSGMPLIKASSGYGIRNVAGSLTGTTNIMTFCTRQSAAFISNSFPSQSTGDCPINNTSNKITIGGFQGNSNCWGVGPGGSCGVWAVTTPNGNQNLYICNNTSNPTARPWFTIDNGDSSTARFCYNSSPNMSGGGTEPPPRCVGGSVPITAATPSCLGIAPGPGYQPFVSFITTPNVIPGAGGSGFPNIAWPAAPVDRKYVICCKFNDDYMPQ